MYPYDENENRNENIPGEENAAELIAASESEEEFRIFAGSPLRWLEKGAADYRNGVIESAGERVVTLRTDSGEVETVSVDNILKAKLNG